VQLMQVSDLSNRRSHGDAAGGTLRSGGVPANGHAAHLRGAGRIEYNTTH
jgi:hypothetical protein